MVDRTDPLPAFRFEVTIDDMEVAAFSDCSGLQLETEVHDYAEGGSNDSVHRFPTRTKQVSLSLKRGVVDRELWDWFAEAAAGRMSLRSGTVAVLDESGGVAAEWDFYDAFPAKWVGPELVAAQSQVAVETFELAHQGLTRRR